MQRRDFLKVVALTAATEASSAKVVADAQVGGPFALPTAKFKAGAQHELPSWAFTRELAPLPVPLPTAIGRFEEIANNPVFGTIDPIPPGECFHGIAREWGETPQHWEKYGCNPSLTQKEAWENKQSHFGTVDAFDGSGKIPNWSGYKIKCYKLSIEQAYKKLRLDAAFPARLYGYAGRVPGPMFKMRLGEPVVVRYENRLEAEASIHLHGGHSPSHSDGFPSFYVLQGKSRDYFYPNILPLFPEELAAGETVPKYAVDIGESQSTMWYHDHAMDATAYNVSKGMAGPALCFGERELELISTRVLPGYGPDSCKDHTCIRYDSEPRDPDDPDKVITVKELLQKLEDPDAPGYFEYDKQPYFNPFDIPLILQDKVIDTQTGQIAYDLTDHNGYLGDTFFVNGEAWPKIGVRNRKYRFRILDGSNARVYRLRIMRAEDFWKAQRFGIDSLTDGQGEDANGENDPIAGDHGNKYDRFAKPFLRIGKDSWLWSKAVEKRSVLLAMANRADIVVDFGALAEGLRPGEEQEFVLVNTMPQFDGRGPKSKLEDGGDPRVLPVPFDLPGKPLVELNRPIGLLKFVVRHNPPGSSNDPPGDREATIENDTSLIESHRRIKDDEIVAVREFIFERGKGAWQINGRFYDPYIANAAPKLDGAEEWVFRNGGGGWWHPIHVHLESHQLVSYEKDFVADQAIVLQDPPPRNDLLGAIPIQKDMDQTELFGLHDTQILGPNTVVRIRMRHRTWSGPFVFHCHNLEHEDMRMMFNFEPVPYPEAESEKLANIAPSSRTHGNDVTLNGDPRQFGKNVGELPWHHAAIPKTPVQDGGEEQILPRPKAR